MCRGCALKNKKETAKMKNERKEILKKNLDRVEAALTLFMDFQEEDKDLYPIINGPHNTHESLKEQNDKAIKEVIKALDRLAKHICTELSYYPN